MNNSNNIIDNKDNKENKKKIKENNDINNSFSFNVRSLGNLLSTTAPNLNGIIVDNSSNGNGNHPQNNNQNNNSKSNENNQTLIKKGSDNNLVNSTKSIVDALNGVKNMINGGSNVELNAQSQKLHKTLSGIIQKFRLQTPESHLGLVIAYSESLLTPIMHPDLEFTWYRSITSTTTSLTTSNSLSSSESTKLLPLAHLTNSLNPNHAWYPVCADDIGHTITMKCKDLCGFNLNRQLTSKIIQVDPEIASKVEEAIQKDRLLAKVIISSSSFSQTSDFNQSNQSNQNNQQPESHDFEIVGSIEVGSKGLLLCEKGVDYGGLRFQPSSDIQVTCVQPSGFILRAPLLSLNVDDSCNGIISSSSSSSSISKLSTTNDSIQTTTDSLNSQNNENNEIINQQSQQSSNINSNVVPNVYWVGSKDGEMYESLSDLLTSIQIFNNNNNNNNNLNDNKNEKNKTSSSSSSSNINDSTLPSYSELLLQNNRKNSIPYVELLISCRDRLIRDTIVLSIRGLASLVIKESKTLNSQEINDSIQFRLNSLPWKQLSFSSNNSSNFSTSPSTSLVSLNTNTTNSSITTSNQDYIIPSLQLELENLKNENIQLKSENVLLSSQLLKQELSVSQISKKLSSSQNNNNDNDKNDNDNEQMYIKKLEKELSIVKSELNQEKLLRNKLELQLNLLQNNSIESNESLNLIDNNDDNNNNKIFQLTHQINELNQKYLEISQLYQQSLIKIREFEKIFGVEISNTIEKSKMYSPPPPPVSTPVISNDCSGTEIILTENSDNEIDNNNDESNSENHNNNNNNNHMNNLNINYDVNIDNFIYHENDNNDYNDNNDNSDNNDLFNSNDNISYERQSSGEYESDINEDDENLKRLTESGVVFPIIEAVSGNLLNECNYHNQVNCNCNGNNIDENENDDNNNNSINNDNNDNNDNCDRNINKDHENNDNQYKINKNITNYEDLIIEFNEILKILLSHNLNIAEMLKLNFPLHLFESLENNISNDTIIEEKENEENNSEIILSKKQFKLITLYFIQIYQHIEWLTINLPTLSQINLLSNTTSPCSLKSISSSRPSSMKLLSNNIQSNNYNNNNNNLNYNNTISNIIQLEKQTEIEVQILHENLEKLQVKYDNLENENKEITKQLNKIYESHNLLQQIIKQQSEQNQMIIQNNKLKNEEILKNNNEKIIQLENEIKLNNKNYEMNLNNLQNEILDLSDKKNNLIKQLQLNENNKIHLTQMKSEILHKDHEINSLKEIIMKNNIIIENNNKLNNEININLNNKNALNNKLNERITELVSRVETIENELQNSEKDRKNLRKENIKLRNLLNEATEKNNTLSSFESLYNKQLEIITNNHCKMNDLENYISKLSSKQFSYVIRIIQNELNYGIIKNKYYQLHLLCERYGMKMEDFSFQIIKLNEILYQKEIIINKLQNDLQIAKEADPFQVKRLNFMISKLNGEKNHYENKAKSLSKDLQRKLLDGTPLQRELARITARLEEVENERNAYRDAMVLACDTFVERDETYSWFS